MEFSFSEMWPLCFRVKFKIFYKLIKSLSSVLTKDWLMPCLEHNLYKANIHQKKRHFKFKINDNMFCHKTVRNSPLYKDGLCHV